MPARTTNYAKSSRNKNFKEDFENEENFADFYK